MINNSASLASQPEVKNDLNAITDAIIAESIEIHKKLGPGLLESVYEMVLAKKLERRGLKVERQKTVSFEYEGIRFEEGFRVDLLIENSVVVELKSVEKTSPVHQKQLLTYLKLLNKTVRLLINFGCATLKEGLQRVVNHYPDSASPASQRENI